jgi:hypothetical protein
VSRQYRRFKENKKSCLRKAEEKKIIRDVNIELRDILNSKPMRCVVEYELIFCVHVNDDQHEI